MLIMSLGILAKKREMTRVYEDGKMVPVTVLEVVPQEVVRTKRAEKDGYNAIVIWTGKKELDKDKGIKTKYVYQREFRVDILDVAEEFVDNFLKDLKEVKLRGVSKGKGFQGVVKRFGFGGGPDTHGSKFHREIGSTGQRKPRRTAKWYPMPGRMWGEKITLASVKVVSVIEKDGKKLILVKWSVPGAYNSIIELMR